MTIGSGEPQAASGVTPVRRAVVIRAAAALAVLVGSLSMTTAAHAWPSCACG